MSRSSSTTSIGDTTGPASRRQRIEAVGFDPHAVSRETVTHCNLCGAIRFCTITWQDRYGYDCPCQLCLGCGLVFLSPRLTADEYRRFYDGVYRPLVSAYHGRTIDAETVEDDQRTYTGWLRAFLEPALAGHQIGRLLDIGGSTGVVAESVSGALGCRGAVLDPAPAELDRAADRGLETVAGLLEDLDPARAGTCDLVLLCQTVDHLLDIAAALTKIRRILADDGHFYVDFVDFRAIALREGAVEEAVKVDHPFSLARQTMEAFLTVSGFEITAMCVLPDGHHVGCLCRKTPARGLPDMTGYAEQALDELRAIQARSKR